MERNPWANAQHPAHSLQRQQIRRQVSALSRAPTPSSTPPAQRRVVDLTKPQGSASTIAEPQSGPNSSMVPTTATGEPETLAQLGKTPLLGGILIDSTPSRMARGSVEAIPAAMTLLETATDNGGEPQSNIPDHRQSSSVPENISRETQASIALPKPLPFMQSGSSSSKLNVQTSSPARYPTIKAEDTSYISRHSPVSHQYHVPAPVSAMPGGELNRFIV